MTEGEAAAGAVTETTVFLSHFEDLPDYRQKGKVAYPLDEVLLLMLAAALAGAETVADIARFGRAKLAFLQRFRRFDNGTPSHDCRLHDGRRRSAEDARRRRPRRCSTVLAPWAFVLCRLGSCAACDRPSCS